MAIGHMTAADVARLRELLRETEPCAQEEDFGGYWKANRQWHWEIYRLADNQRLLDMIENLYQYSDRYPEYFTSQEAVKKSLVEHGRILEACERGQVALAGELMKVHTMDSCQKVLEIFRRNMEKKE